MAKCRTHDEELGWGSAVLPVRHLAGRESDILYMITLCSYAG
ncbi:MULTISPECIES: hypothetical protein [Fictibacillus]|nr:MULTISPECIES: hypothetical protein [Fictibacillus]